MLNYYTFIQQYWQAQYNGAASAVSVGLAQNGLVLLQAQIQNDDTPANQALLDAETASQQAYVDAFLGNQAGIVTPDQLATALAAYQAAKTARSAILPTYQNAITTLSAGLQPPLAIYQKQYNDDVDEIASTLEDHIDGVDIPALQADAAACAIKITGLQSAINILSTFTETLNNYVTGIESQLTAIETTGQTPITYQDIIDQSSTLSFTGTPSDAVGAISPITGQLTGSMQVAMQAPHMIWWTGTGWQEIPDAIDQVALPSLLPATAAVNTIFRVPLPVLGTTTVTYNYYRWTGTAWQLMDEYWTIDGWNEIPESGYRIGDCHQVIERLVPLIFDGYDKVRINHSALYNDQPGQHLPPGFIDNSIQPLITGLADTQTAITNITNPDTGDIAVLTSSLSNLQNLVGQFSSSTAITYAEAQTWELSKDQLISDATFLEETAADLEITTQLVSYKTAIGGGASPYNNGLIDIIAPWINQAESNYPIAITSGQQSSIAAAFSAAQSAQSALQTAISAAQAAGVQESLTEFQTSVDGQFTTINGSLSNFDTQFGQYSSDGYLSQTESQSLSLSLAQAVAQSTGVIGAATALGITFEVTAYQSALTTLQTDVAPWIGQSSYPIAITPTQRAAIEVAFGQVQETATTLQNTIVTVASSQAQAAAISATDAILASTNSQISGLSSDFNAAFSDNTITIIEANQISVDLALLQASMVTLTSNANTLGITTELTNYTADFNALSSALSAWTGLSSYPVSITTGQRQNITTLFQACQNAETVLVNKINSATAANTLLAASNSIAAQIGSTNLSIENINSTLESAGTSLVTLNNDLAALSSITELTLAEANALKSDLAQAQANLVNSGSTLYTVANALGITTQLTAYQAAVSALASGLAPWVNS
jgi:hypothetical protein